MNLSVTLWTHCILQIQHVAVIPKFHNKTVRLLFLSNERNDRLIKSVSLSYRFRGLYLRFASLMDCLEIFDFRYPIYVIKIDFNKLLQNFSLSFPSSSSTINCITLALLYNLFPSEQSWYTFASSDFNPNYHPLLTSPSRFLRASLLHKQLAEKKSQKGKNAPSIYVLIANEAL